MVVHLMAEREQAMSKSSTTLQRFFAGITENVFQVQLGVADVCVVDYVSDLLVRFVRTEAMYKVRSLSGRPMTQVAEMLGEANVRVGLARRVAHQHAGDFALFWAGLYPEALRYMQSARRQDFFNDYRQQGRLAYRVASSIETGRSEFTPCRVLETMSHQFDLCAYGLREVRREWERRDDEDMIRPLLIN